MINKSGNKVIAITFLSLLSILGACSEVHAKTAGTVTVGKALGDCDVTTLDKRAKDVRGAMEKTVSIIGSMQKDLTKLLDKKGYKGYFENVDLTITCKLLAVVEKILSNMVETIGVYKVIDSKNDPNTIAGALEIVRNSLDAVYSAKTDKKCNKKLPSFVDAVRTKAVHICVQSLFVKIYVQLFVKHLMENGGFTMCSDCGNDAEKIKKDIQKIFVKMPKLEEQVAKLMENLAAIIILLKAVPPNTSTALLQSSVQTFICILYYAMGYFSQAVLTIKYISDNLVSDPNALQRNLVNLIEENNMQNVDAY